MKTYIKKGLIIFAKSTFTGLNHFMEMPDKEQSGSKNHISIVALTANSMKRDKERF
ncbi:MAG: hypothetical protein GY699_18095 [Desulfobacteraceae bacterium]|nr:hypothetical protein [Desulfobacteraceae bacterium]